MPESYVLAATVRFNTMFPDEAGAEFVRYMAHESGFPCDLIEKYEVNPTLWDIKIEIPFDVWDDEDPEEVALNIIESHLDADGNPLMIADEIYCNTGVDDE